jgi:hypothetical protein
LPRRIEHHGIEGFELTRRQRVQGRAAAPSPA